MLTNVVSKETNKNYFQLNSYIALFTIIIFMNPLFRLNEMTKWILVSSFILFSSAVKYGFTVDNIITLIIVHQLVQIHI